MSTVTKPRPKPQAKQDSSGEFQGKNDLFWIGFLAGTLEQILLAKDVIVAHAIARRGLRQFVSNVTSIPEEIKNEWSDISREE